MANEFYVDGAVARLEARVSETIRLLEERVANLEEMLSRHHHMPLSGDAWVGPLSIKRILDGEEFTT